MNEYRVKIKRLGAKEMAKEKEEVIMANSELEAKVEFCRRNNLNYRHLASKLEVYFIGVVFNKK